MVCLEKWGINALSKISGMFAFCYIDQDIKKELIARDRFGQKPLYYFLDEEKFIFSSEIKPIIFY